MTLKNPLPKIIDSIKNSRTKRNELEKKIQTFWDDFDTLNISSKEKILRVVQFVLYDEGSSSDIVDDDEKIQKKLTAMRDTLLHLPEEKFMSIAKLIETKMKEQKELTDTLISPEAGEIEPLHVHMEYEHK